MLIMILLVFALVFFILAGLNIPSPPKLQFVGWGLAFITLALLFHLSGYSLPIK